MEDRRVIGDQSLDQALSKIRKLIAMAEDPECDPNEAARMQSRADALMFKYAVDKATARNSAPAAEKTRPMKIVVEIGRWDMDIAGWVTQLCQDVAEHCRCKIRTGYYSQDYNIYAAKVYGFESDVRYFEILYTSLRLHMLGILMPKMDPQLSLQENAYRLHEAGFNWLQMAAMDGWKKYGDQKGVAGHLVEYYNQGPENEVPFGGRTTAGKIGGHYKRAYYKACEDKGEKPKVISAGGTDTYRRSAAMGYEYTLRQRLDEQRRSHDTVGAGIVLASAFEDVEAMFREDNPELFKTHDPEPSTETAVKVRKVRTRKYVEPKFSDAGYANGVKYGKTADLNTGVGGKANREIS